MDNQQDDVYDHILTGAPMKDCSNFKNKSIEISVLKLIFLIKDFCAIIEFTTLIKNLKYPFKNLYLIFYNLKLLLLIFTIFNSI